MVFITCKFFKKNYLTGRYIVERGLFIVVCVLNKNNFKDCRCSHELVLLCSVNKIIFVGLWLGLLLSNSKITTK